MKKLPILRQILKVLLKFDYATKLYEVFDSEMAARLLRIFKFV